jgi:hypothetical protein
VVVLPTAVDDDDDDDDNIIPPVECASVFKIYFAVFVALSGVFAIAKMCPVVAVLPEKPVLENTTDKQVIWFKKKEKEAIIQWNTQMSDME